MKASFLVFLALLASTPAQAEGGARFGLGASYGLLNSTSGFGGEVELLFKASSQLPLYVGLQTGFMHWGDSTSSGFISGAINSIPIMPQVIYEFEVPDSSVKPYVGAALGMNISFISLTIGSSSGSDTQVYFEGLIKTGVNINHWFIEPAFGLFKDQFLFQPTVGYYFEI